MFIYFIWGQIDDHSVGLKEALEGGGGIDGEWSKPMDISNVTFIASQKEHQLKEIIQEESF